MFSNPKILWGMSEDKMSAVHTDFVALPRVGDEVMWKGTTRRVARIVWTPHRTAQDVVVYVK